MNDGSFNEFYKHYGKAKVSARRREAVDNDRRLQDLATYEITKGLTVALENLEDILPKFAEYKNLVKRGSFTIDELEDNILTKYAIVTKKESPLDDIEFLEEEPESIKGSNEKRD